MTLAERYAALRADVPARTGILAVSKFQPAERIAEAIAAGVTDIGENYVQEAGAKFDMLREAQHDKGVTKHFIGHVQTNKAKAIAQTFDVVQSVDRIEAAQALAKAAAALGNVLPVLLQLNISPSERHGCPPAQAERLAAGIRGLPSLRLDGVMAIGPIAADRDEIRRAFELAAETWRRTGGPVLSIGMSGDWREAVEAGSTLVRIGTAIFGPRPAARASKNPAMSSPNR